MKLLKIIITIIVIVAVITGAAWLVMRKKAQNENKQPATFKEFISTDVPLETIDQNQNPLSGNFIDQNQNSIDDREEGKGLDQKDVDPGTRTSSFTGSSISPASSSNNGSNGNNSTPGGGNTPNSGGGTSTPGRNTTLPDRTIITIPTKGSPLTSETGCTPADLNITFDPTELAKLKALQERFYTIAQTLHSDADTKTQIANYDAFLLKETKLTELLKYCEGSEGKFPNKVEFTRKVPTPFWWEPGSTTKPSEVRYNKTFLFNFATRVSDITDSGVPLGYVMDSGQIGGKIDSIKDIDVLKRSLERILRLNLW